MFPRHIIERILSFSDGKTLCAARQVNDTWRDCVNYLSQKTPIWEQCCKEDIPEDELIEYLMRHDDKRSDERFMYIYENWYAWQDIGQNIKFDIILSPAEIPRITCISTSGRYIAVGSEDGRLRLFNDSWECLYMFRYVGGRITAITFIQDGLDETDPLMLVFYKNGNLYFIDIDQQPRDPPMIQEVKMYSVYKSYICIVKIGERISILKLLREPNGLLDLSEIRYVRIYSPDEVNSVNNWNNVCTFLMNSCVKTLTYDDDIQAMSYVQKKTTLQFVMKSNVKIERTCQIYRSNIIISLYCVNYNQQFLELFILGKKKFLSKKMFNAWEEFNAYITCMFLYGNTFIVGVDSGIIYLYNIDSWKSFDVRKYGHKLIIGKHPIISIDVQETKFERKFLVASSFNVHEIVGYRIKTF